MEALLPPLALLVERLAGYPPHLLAAIGHPVMWMGRFIGWFELRFNRATDGARVRRRAGVVMLVALLALTLGATLLLNSATARLSHGWVLDALLASTLLAQKELGRAVSAVRNALGRSLAEGRAAVSHIVGRDPEALDEAGVSRAAIESLAESTCDGVVAPLFWLLLLGLPGIALYKAINTADSMVGHLDARYRDFGWASARLDDAVNWLPARITAALIAGAAFFLPGADGKRAMGTARRDAAKHASPNAGWPEAAMAGALGISLGGPRSYGGETVDLPRLGNGRSSLGPADIGEALVLYRMAFNILVAATLAVALLRLAA